MLQLLVGCQSYNFNDGMALSANRNTGFSKDYLQSIYSFNVSKITEPLSLQLDITEANTKRLELVATLTNVSEEDLTISVPQHINPLT